MEEKTLKVLMVREEKSFWFTVEIYEKKGEMVGISLHRDGGIYMLPIDFFSDVKLTDEKEEYLLDVGMANEIYTSFSPIVESVQNITGLGGSFSFEWRAKCYDHDLEKEINCRIIEYDRSNGSFIIKRENKLLEYDFDGLESMAVNGIRKDVPLESFLKKSGLKVIKEKRSSSEMVINEDGVSEKRRGTWYSEEMYYVKSESGGVEASFRELEELNDYLRFKMDK